MITKKKLNISQLAKLVNSQDYIKTHFVSLAMNKRSNAIKHLVDKEDLINMIWKRCVILFLLIKTQPKQILSTLVLAQKNKWMTFLDKLSISNQKIQNTLHIQLFQILVQELISNEKDFKPFWIPAYNILSEKLSLPTEIDFPDLALNLLNVSLQKPVAQSQCLTIMETKAQNKNLRKTYYQLSTSTVVNKWENEAIKTPLKNLKIQLKPTIYQRKILNEWIKTSNYVYNKTIACINNGDKVNFINLRDKCVTSRTKKSNNQYPKLTENIKMLKKQIKEEKNEEKLVILNKQLISEINQRKAIKFENNTFVQEWESKTPKAIRDGAVGDVCKANDTGWSNLKAGNINHFKLGFRKITKNTKSFVLPHSLISNKNGILSISPEYLKEECKFKMGKRTLKKYKNIEIKNDCRIIHDRNKYYIAIPIPILSVLKHKIKSVNYCGIDPGVRTFLTSFGNNGVVEYNQNKMLLKKLNKKIDLLNSKRTRKRYKYKVEERKENVINEIHWKSINDILKRNDYVFYGDIKSHDIVKKSNNKYLNRDTNDLKFYKFKERLMYKASVLNKCVFNINEMYTTKTCSSCGNLNNVGKKEIYKCERSSCDKLLLRDVSAAKNILMKGIMRYLV